MAHQQQIHQHTFDNGLVLIAQSMPWLQSAAFSLNLPAGCRFDPPQQPGLSNFTCEMLQRGCGEMSSIDFVEALESSGIDHNSASSVYHLHFGGAMCADQLLRALEIHADVVLRPHLPSDQLEDGRLVCLQEIQANEDDLPQRVLTELRSRHYGQPDGRDCHGTLESVKSITIEDIRRFHESHFHPNGAVIAVAGKIDWVSIVDHVGRLLGDWQPRATAEPSIVAPTHGSHHIAFDSQQTQIAVAYASIPYSHPDYFQARGSVGVLSDGLSSRLFDEVREKRGLCYSVFASSHSLKDCGSVVCYSGTTASRAQETLDVLIEQLVNLKHGIRADELRRLKVQIRSGLIMQQESSRSRASAIAGDWFHLGRIRLLDELNERVNALTVESINAWLAENPPANFDLVTLGPEPLNLTHHAVSATSA